MLKSSNHKKRKNPLLKFSAHDNMAHYVKSSKQKMTRTLFYSSAYIQFWALDTKVDMAVNLQVIHFELFIASSNINKTSGNFLIAT
jgi:uncharacterized protein YijF (DUF1287 family)